MALGYGGTCRAVVVDNVDPMAQNRLMLAVPEAPELPAVGSGVWLQFDGGDPSHPEWTGVQ
jgi:hypothetical protein